MNGSYAQNDDENKQNDDDNEQKQAHNQQQNDDESEDGVRLESMYSHGLFLSVHPNDGVYINRQRDHQHNLFYFLVQGKNDEVVLFKTPYSLKQQNTIIISHCFGGSIRMHPNEPIVDSDGDKDILSQWEALPDDDGKILQL